MALVWMIYIYTYIYIINNNKLRFGATHRMNEVM